MSHNLDRESLIPAAVRMYLDEMISLPEVASKLGVAIYWVRSRLLRAGVTLRTRADGVRLAGPRRSAATKGVKRGPFTEEWKQNISEARKAWGEKHAAGTTIKPSGYVEYTRGPNKGRSVHVVTMERHIGRSLADGECVHHIDENKQNNDISNLMLMTIAEHVRHHRLQEMLRGEERERRENGQFC